MDQLSAAAATAVAGYGSTAFVAVVVAGKRPNEEQNYNDPYAFVVVVKEVTHVKITSIVISLLSYANPVFV